MEIRESPTPRAKAHLKASDSTYEFVNEVDDEERKLEKNPIATRKELIELRDQLLVSEIEIRHSEKYQLIISFFVTYIEDQLIDLKNELEEYLQYE